MSASNSYVIDAANRALAALNNVAALHGATNITSTAGYSSTMSNRARMVPLIIAQRAVDHYQSLTSGSANLEQQSINDSTIQLAALNVVASGLDLIAAIKGSAQTVNVVNLSSGQTPRTRVSPVSDYIQCLDSISQLMAGGNMQEG